MCSQHGRADGRTCAWRSRLRRNVAHGADRSRTEKSMIFVERSPSPPLPKELRCRRSGAIRCGWGQRQGQGREHCDTRVERAVADTIGGFGLPYRLAIIVRREDSPIITNLSFGGGRRSTPRCGRIAGRISFAARQPGTDRGSPGLTVSRGRHADTRWEDGVRDVAGAEFASWRSTWRRARCWRRCPLVCRPMASRTQR